MRVESLMIPVLRQVIKRPRLSQAMFGFDSWGNPFSVEANADPYALLPTLRAEGPVVHKRLYQQWFVSGYDEARTVLSSSDAISSPQVDMLLDVRPYTKLSPAGRSFLRNFLLGVDPPAHTRLRGLVNRAFTPRQVAQLDERMDTIIDELVADLDPTKPDLVDGFTAPFPIHVIAELLGVPPERRAWVREMAASITRLLDPFRGFDPTAMNAALDEFHDYVLDLASQRRADPRDDLLTGLAMAEDGGDRLSEDELVSVFGLILTAGHDTTTGVLGNALLALARFPEQRQWIREHPDRWPNAVEELIRFDTSVKSDPRAAKHDLHLGGKTIPAGANIVVMLAMANRDPRRFEDPDSLRLDRDDPSPISFGHGIHYCLGANLARMEIRKGLQRLLAEFGDYTIDETGVEWKPSITLRGPAAFSLVPG